MLFLPLVGEPYLSRSKMEAGRNIRDRPLLRIEGNAIPGKSETGGLPYETVHVERLTERRRRLRIQLDVDADATFGVLFRAMTTIHELSLCGGVYMLISVFRFGHVFHIKDIGCSRGEDGA